MNDDMPSQCERMDMSAFVGHPLTDACMELNRLQKALYPLTAGIVLKLMIDYDRYPELRKLCGGQAQVCGVFLEWR